MTSQLERYQHAARKFVGQQKQDDDIIGIILTGSMVHGTLDKHSDIDVSIILRPECDYRERGNTWIEGIEIEYFKNPPQQIRSYFRSERSSPHTAHMLAHGELVYQQDPVVEALIREAKSIWASPPPALRSAQIELAQYHIDDILKDLADSHDKGDTLAASLILSHVIDFSINLFCMHHRIYRAKAKGLHTQLTEMDPVFSEIIFSLLQAGEMAENVARLRRYMAALLGGERPREWALKSALSL